jgi:hypothetical protein
MQGATGQHDLFHHSPGHHYPAHGHGHGETHFSPYGHAQEHALLMHPDSDTSTGGLLSAGMYTYFVHSILPMARL